MGNDIEVNIETTNYSVDNVDNNITVEIKKEPDVIVELNKQGPRGDVGETGPTGNGIEKIEKTSTAGLVDTYTITYTNGDTTTFTVTNGEGQVNDVTVNGTSVLDSHTAKILLKTINSQDIAGTGNITIDSLPTQTGQSGKFLTTDGTDASWKTFPDATPSTKGLVQPDNTTITINDGVLSSNFNNLLNKSQITNCVLEAPNGVATYSSNVITVKEGLKVLIPDGRNADGTLKNIEYTVLSDTTLTVAHEGIFTITLAPNGSVGYFGSADGGSCQKYTDLPTPTVGKWYFYYVEELNEFYSSENGGAYTKSSYCILGNFTSNSSFNVTKIYINEPLNLLKTSDKREITNWCSSNYSTRTAQSWNTNYVAQTDGFIDFNVQGSNQDDVYLTINNVDILIGGQVGNSYQVYHRHFVPISKNDTYKVRGGGGGLYFTSLKGES